MTRPLVIAWIAIAVCAPAAGAATPATCSALEHSRRAEAVAAFVKQMPAARRAYFKHHRKAAQRKRFVAAQSRKLAGLRAAASCVVLSAPVTPVVVPTPPATPGPPAPTPPVAPAIKPAAVHIADDVDSRVADDVRLGVSTGDAFFRRIGAPDTWRYDYWADSDANALAALWPTLGTGNNAYTAHLVFVTLGATAVADHDQVLHRTEGPYVGPAHGPSAIPIHELFHTVQNALLGPYQSTGAPVDEIKPGGPAWLREGTADYMGADALIDAGLFPGVSSISALHAGKAYTATHAYASIPLDAVATQASLLQSPTSSAVYPLGWLATEVLIADTSPEAILEFYRRVGQGTPWPTAFQDVFGRTIDAFYAEFAAARATW